MSFTVSLQVRVNLWIDVIYQMMIGKIKSDRSAFVELLSLTLIELAKCRWNCCFKLNFK